ncbi:MAG: cytidylate kinase family protein [Candidatus Thorarchaeota archaeon]
MSLGICIAISGSHGSGTSSTAKALAKKLNLRYVSAGSIFRAFAKERGYNLADFQQIVESDKSMKVDLDRTLCDEARIGSVVIEGRVACWVANEFIDYCVFLDAPFDIRVERIAARQNMTVEGAKQETHQREKEERAWFKKEYNIDIEDKSICDIYLNTSKFSMNEIIYILICAISTSTSSNGM